jgi:hypothetical protein
VPFSPPVAGRKFIARTRPRWVSTAGAIAPKFGLRSFQFSTQLQLLTTGGCRSRNFRFCSILLSGLAASAFLLDSLRNQAISLKCPAQAMLSEMAIYHQLIGLLAA